MGVTVKEKMVMRRRGGEMGVGSGACGRESVALGRQGAGLAATAASRRPIIPDFNSNTAGETHRSQGVSGRPIRS